MYDSCLMRHTLYNTSIGMASSIVGELLELLHTHLYKNETKLLSMANKEWVS